MSGSVPLVICRESAGDRPWYAVTTGRPATPYEAVWIGPTRVAGADAAAAVREPNSVRFFPTRDAIVAALSRVDAPIENP